MASDKAAGHLTALPAPFPTSMAGSPPAGQSVDPQFCALPSAPPAPEDPQFCALPTPPPAPDFIAPPSYSPTPVQTHSYPVAAGPGGYAQVPGQAPYYGPPYTDQSGYPGQKYGPGPGFGPPGPSVHMGGAPPVVTMQIVLDPGVTMLQVPPANNSLIMSSMGTRCLSTLITGI